MYVCIQGGGAHQLHGTHVKVRTWATFRGLVSNYLMGCGLTGGVSRHRLGLSCIPRSFYYLALIPSRYVTRINIEILSTKKIAKKIRRSAEINQVIGQRLTPPLSIGILILSKRKNILERRCFSTFTTLLEILIPTTPKRKNNKKRAKERIFI